MPSRNDKPPVSFGKSRPLESRYMEWAKAHLKVRYNLVNSGVSPCAIDLLSPSVDDFTMIADNEYGWKPLVERIARRYAVDTDCVVLAHGTSMANHLACATLLDAGDDVLVESPGYEPLRVLPQFLHCEVRVFERRAEQGYRLDIDLIERALTRRTRLVIISNPHNPTGAVATDDELRGLAVLADTYDFRVLVDEVYLEWLYGDGANSAINLSPRFVTTRSLTKVYGLAALRAGWILAEPDLADRMKRLSGLFTVTIAHPTERLAARALDRATLLLEPLRSLVAGNRAAVAELVEASPKLSWVPPEAGTVGFVRLNTGNVDMLVERLVAQHDTSVAPGHFFGAADHFRIGFGMDTAQLTEGLQRLDAALSE
jgi:aspartate/methionine/tyrosine aminotransferase